jgi:hypothetical protein
MSFFKNPLLKKYLIIVLVTVLGLVLAGCAGSGLFPQFTYQGVLTDASGNPYNGPVTIRYRIFNVSTSGTALYSESENVTVTDGRFDSVVGPGTVMGGLEPKDLAQPLWIELEVGNGVYTETLTPRQRLYGAPYAFTLMPGTVISQTLIENGVIDAIASVVNMEPSETNALPALRVAGNRGIELVDVAGSHGTLYSDLDGTSSDLYIYSNDDIAFFLDNNNAGDADSKFWVYGTGTDYCWIDWNGDFDCTGTKSSLMQVDGDMRALYALETPGVWFEDFGSTQLVGGQATVQVETLFAKTVNLEAEYHVFLTPLGDCNGLYVTNKTATSFEVHELGGGSSDVSFDYRIVAKRAGYEDLRMEVVPADHDVEGQ